jgi:hypothetical protein
MPAKIMSNDDDYDLEIVNMGETDTKVGNKTVEDDFADEYDNMVLKNSEKRRKDDERSKKMGDLLLQGWAMLADVCDGKYYF